MTTAPIDVLAVMDASAEKITFLAQKTGVYHPATDLIEARAAVAELIEAIKQYQSDYTDDGCPDENCVLCRRSQVADDRLRAALTRVSGG